MHQWDQQGRPVWFAAFTNDLPDAVQSLCSMYTDDTNVFQRSIELQKELQIDIYILLVDWEDKWQLCFNARKCKVLHSGKTNVLYEFHMRKYGSLELVTLEQTEQEKDLGTIWAVI